MEKQESVLLADAIQEETCEHCGNVYKIST